MAGTCRARHDFDRPRRVARGGFVRIPRDREARDGSQRRGSRARPSWKSCGSRLWISPYSKSPQDARVFARERREGAPLMAGIPPRPGRGLVDRCAAGRARLRAVSLSSAGSGGPGAGRAVPRPESVGILRFLLSRACRRRLLRAQMEGRRNRRSARRRVALLGARSAGRRIPAPFDRGLPSQRHPGLRLVRAAARQRRVLGPASGVARKHRAAAGRATGLAQADEPDQPAGASRPSPQACAISLGASIGTE